MWAGQENFEFEAFQLLGKIGQVAIQVLFVLGLFGLGLGLGQFEHDLEIGQLPLGFNERLDFFAQRIGFVDESLGFFAVIPEALLSHQSVELGRRFCTLGTSKKPP